MQADYAVATSRPRKKSLRGCNKKASAAAAAFSTYR